MVRGAFAGKRSAVVRMRRRRRSSSMRIQWREQGRSCPTVSSDPNLCLAYCWPHSLFFGVAAATTIMGKETNFFEVMEGGDVLLIMHPTT